MLKDDSNFNNFRSYSFLLLFLVIRFDRPILGGSKLIMSHDFEGFAHIVWVVPLPNS